MMEKEVLIKEYVKALRSNNASVFIGSGISAPIFSKCWKELILPYATKLGLCEGTMGEDYPFIAQSYINCGNDELSFKQEISDNFKSTETTNVHNILAGLPIRNYWTTNYDELLENALANKNKHFDLVFNNDSFSSLDDRRDLLFTNVMVIVRNPIV